MLQDILLPWNSRLKEYREQDIISLTDIRVYASTVGISGKVRHTYGCMKYRSCISLCQMERRGAEGDKTGMAAITSVLIRNSCESAKFFE